MFSKRLVHSFPPNENDTPSLAIGYGKNRCIRDLNKYSKRLRRGVRRVRQDSDKGLKRANDLLAKMERTYYRYRIDNLKYNSPVDENFGTSTGTLKVFRDLLKGIVLDERVPPEIKKKAISILLAQQSNKVLYDIARTQESIGQYIDIKNNIFVAKYIIQNFPVNSDHDLINLAFYWANHDNYELTTLAINKITSPKSLVTLCLFFHDNPKNKQYITYIINQFGNIINENATLLDNDDKRNYYLNGDCEKENYWLKRHEMSMLYSAHVALEKIIVVFADENNRNSDSVSTCMEEQVYVKLAINMMKVPSFLLRIIKTNNNVDKVDWCEDRFNILTDFKYKENVTKVRIRAGNLATKDMLKAIELLDFGDKNNNSVAHALDKRLTKYRAGEDTKLDRDVAQFFCQKRYGDHDYQPVRGEQNVEECTRCGARRNTNPFYETRNSAYPNNQTSDPFAQFIYSMMQQRNSISPPSNNINGNLPSAEDYTINDVTDN